MNPNKYLFLLLSFFLLSFANTNAQDKEKLSKKFRAVWIATVNIDWPKAVRILLRNKSGLS
jgi:hypothetical protein